METMTFDESRLEELSRQEPQAPWGRRTSSFRTAVILGVLVPAAIIVGLWFYSDLPKPVASVRPCEPPIPTGLPVMKPG